MKKILTLLSISLTALSLADGTFFKEKQPGLVEAKPSIREQRAVIKYDGYEQTMIIESVVDGPRGAYGWVVPLPTKPSFVKAVKPDYISGTFAQVKPPVKRLPDNPVGWTYLGAGLLSAVILTAGLRYRRFQVGQRVLYFTLEIIGILFLSAILFPVFAQSKLGAKMAQTAAAATDKARAVEVESLGTVGSYEVSVLKSDKATALMEWLKERKINPPKNAVPVIEKYAAEGWVFLAAEFRKGEDRPLPPHPLKAVFPTDEVVYPMRLTGTQDEPLHLELIVVAEKKASIRGMESWACKNDNVLVQVTRDKDLDERVYSDWQGNLFAMAKNGAIVTYLRGDLDPDQMKQDFKVQWQPYERYVAEVHDRDQAQSHALYLGALWFPAGALLFGLLSVLFGSWAKAFALGGIAAAAISGSTAGSLWYSSVEKVDTETGFYAQPLH